MKVWINAAFKWRLKTDAGTRDGPGILRALERAPNPPFVLKVSFDAKCRHFFSEANRSKLGQYSKEAQNSRYVNYMNYHINGF